MRSTALSAICFLALILPRPATAQGNYFIDCAGSPKEARLELPAPAKDWAKVGCTRFGHILMAREGWVWARPNITNPTILPADLLNSKTMRDVGNQVYFREFKIRRLPGADAMKRHELFHPWIGKDRTSIYPEVWELTATNESGKSLVLNVFRHPGKGGWGIACLPDCTLMDPFIMTRPSK